MNHFLWPLLFIQASIIFRVFIIVFKRIAAIESMISLLLERSRE
jgi:hypothetical protein